MITLLSSPARHLFVCAAVDSTVNRHNANESSSASSNINCFAAVDGFAGSFRRSLCKLMTGGQLLGPTLAPSADTQTFFDVETHKIEFNAPPNALAKLFSLLSRRTNEREIRTPP